MKTLQFYENQGVQIFKKCSAGPNVIVLKGSKCNKLLCIWRSLVTYAKLGMGIWGQENIFRGPSAEWVIMKSITFRYSSRRYCGRGGENCFN